MLYIVVLRYTIKFHLKVIFICRRLISFQWVCENETAATMSQFAEEMQSDS